MVLARKLKSAVQLYRRRGFADVSELAQARTAALYQAFRPLPTSPGRRALMLAATLNRFSGVSRLAIDVADVEQVRPALLFPYMRYHFAETALVATQFHDLRPVETAIVADCQFANWAFRESDEALPAWTASVAGTKFERRIAQTARRIALRLGRLHEAARGLEHDGIDAGAMLLRAEVYDALDRMEEASAAFEAAVHRMSSDPYARRQQGFHQLKSGRVLQGLASWSVADTLDGFYPLRRRRPQWTGEPLGSRHLLVVFEHGLGDMIQMARFLPRLKAQHPDAALMASVPAPLAGLLARNYPDVSFTTIEDREPAYDLFVPSMHLPAVLDATDLEPRNRYIDLGAPSLPRADRPRVGVCWRGHPRQYEATRSILLEMFASLFDAPDFDFVVLLNRLTAEERRMLSAIDRVTIPTIHDFSDLAAVVASCDVVVSVDTAVPHLAAAGGVPVLLLSRPDSCWRWGAASSSSPWYETVEVLRHSGDMNWPNMLVAAKDRLHALLYDDVKRRSTSL